MYCEKSRLASQLGPVHLLAFAGRREGRAKDRESHAL